MASVTTAWRSRVSAVDVAIWALPAALWIGRARLDESLVTLGVMAVLALGIAVVASRRPVAVACGLLVLLPFTGLVLSWLYAQGLSRGLVDRLGGWKELLGAVVAAAALRRVRREGSWHVDGLDIVALAYVSLVAAYALVPSLFVAGNELTFDGRTTAFRASAAFVLLMVAARRALAPGQLRRVAGAAILTATVTAAIGLYETADDEGWNRFLVETIEYPRYRDDVLAADPAAAERVASGDDDLRFYGDIGGRELVRSGSVLLSPLSFGFYLVVPLLLAVERLQRRGVRWDTAVPAGVIAAGLVVTQTRAALLAAAVGLLLSFRQAPGRTGAARARLLLLTLAAAVLAVPLVVGTGLAARVGGAVTGEDESADSHYEQFFEGLATLVDDPLGLGLGSSAGVGQRFGTVQVVSENYYLQVANEVGVVGLVLFSTLTVLVVVRLRHRARTVGLPEQAAMWAAAGGMAVGSFFLHTWNAFQVAWSCWLLIGAALTTSGDDDA